MAEIKIIGGFSENKRKDGSFQTGYQVFDVEGICPTLLAKGGGYGVLIMENTSIDKTRQDKDCSHIQNCQVVVLGNMDNTIDHTFESANRVYDKNNLCPTIPTCAGGGIQPKIIEETHCVGGLSTNKWGNQYHQQDRVYKGDIALAHPANIPEGSYKYIGASRGRNPNNPNDRQKGSPMEQRLEQYRIRKLTPKECWRLMGYTDEDFKKAHDAGVSNSQLYKQAGNAIVKQVLMAIFSQMNIKGVKPWNDMTLEEKYKLIRKSTSEEKKIKNIVKSY